MEEYGTANAKVKVQVLPGSIGSDDLRTCLDVLQQVADDPAIIDGDERFKALVAKIHTTGKKASRAALRAPNTNSDRASREATGIVRKQTGAGHVQPGHAVPAVSRLSKPTRCYICKQHYSELHFFYHMLCPQCADSNYRKRMERADLSGRTVLMTGGRIKIGYQAALRLLRDGASVILTTRFPADAARRYASETDAVDWSHRLSIVGLDLRDIPSVERVVCELHASGVKPDILINNAAQTVKRPLGFYQHLLAGEQVTAESLTTQARALIVAPAPAALLLETRPYYPNLPAMTGDFPPGKLDVDGQQIDLRPDNSWRAKAEDVSTLEMLEVQLVNSVAPFILNSRLKSQMALSPFAMRFIVNVSAMEGVYNRQRKTHYHPHTNMAKAALNMMTRTVADEYARDGIYMNSVDTGWVTDENPHDMKQRAQTQRGFFTPLDIVDGAARILDPIIQAVNGTSSPVYGQFLKDYTAHDW